MKSQPVPQQPGMMEVTEWRVVAKPGVKVRDTMHTDGNGMPNGNVKQLKDTGEIVRGLLQPGGQWLQLIDEPGYVLVQKGGNPLIVQNIPNTPRGLGGKDFPIDPLVTNAPE